MNELTAPAAAAEPALGADVVRARFSEPGIVMAPMEGVHDAAMRCLMGELGGFSWGVAEFLRVSQVPISARQALGHVPELGNGARTPTGLRIDPQLLGSDADNLAASAATLASLGAEAVDLNFGCPAKTVNRHDGGASLLRTPERIYAVVRAVRAAVPARVAVSAKLRLGWQDDHELAVTAAAAIEGGAQWLTVHGRTKADGYRPPARYAPIGRLVAASPVPVVANGDLFGAHALARVRAETGCRHFMLGRGALADPWLARRMAFALGVPQSPDPRGWPSDWPGWLSRYVELALPRCQRPERLLGRLKQWGVLARLHGGSPWIDSVRRCQHIDALIEAVGSLHAPTTMARAG